jgi:predicted ATP-grasp superfamily ATP-dependent carboligase
LIKNRVSCGGLGIRWHCVDQTTAADQLLQQWVAGRSYGATMLACGDDVVLLGVCRSLFSRRGRLPFVYAGSFGPIPVSPETASTLRRLGQQIVATTNLRGLFNVDYLLDRSGDAWLLEINARWSGSSELVEQRLIDLHALGVKNSLFELSIQAIKGSKDSLWDCSEITSASHSPAGESSLSEERGEPSPAVQTSDPPASGRVNQSTSNEVISQQFRSALRELSVGVLSDKNATPVARTMLSSHQDPVSAEEQPVYLKRILFARSDVRFHQSVVRQLTELARGYHAVIHDIPDDGTLIRQAEPMLTLIAKIKPHEKNPMRKQRVLQRDIHAAVKRNPA